MPKKPTTWKDVEAAINAYATQIRECGYTFPLECPCEALRIKLERTIRAYRRAGMKGKQ